MELQTVPVALHGAQGKTAQGTVTVSRLSSRERLWRSLKFMALFWGGAVVAVLIPVLHFILVPGLLLAGILSPFWIYRVSSLIQGGRGACPHCGTQLTILQAREHWPLTEVCESCRNPVSIAPL